MGIDLTKYNSHEKKNLHVHLKNVAGVACERVSDKNSLIVELASIFHDLGKINPQFQKKLKNPHFKNYNRFSYEYTQHAYLSAISWLCFYEENRDLLQETFQLSEAEIIGIAALIARHHGNLPNLGTMSARIFNNSGANPTSQLKKFLQDTDDDEIPISEYLEVSKLLPKESIHNHFNLVDFDEDARDELLDRNLYELVNDPLSLFQDLQFGFACLIESDKRDASENTTFNNKDLLPNFRDKFSVNLEAKLQDIEAKSAEQDNEKKKQLDAIRSQMRAEALANLRKFLAEDKERRVFTLPAPTGAGKTLMLLSLANEILKVREDLSVIYALPFLAITEQTENICLDILKDGEKVLRVDSKAENEQIARLQRILDDNPSDENVKKLLQQLFSNETFDHPFIITTFVQVFETLVSNRNATLLRLPNFSKTIFLLDEIQALPPSLYTFFVAYLDEFCRKFDSYAIVSTATMPHLELPDEKNYTNERQKPGKVFTRYKEPEKILDKKFYKLEEFNRYKIIPNFKIETIGDLAEEIRNQKESCLVVLNTIKDTKNLFKELNGNSESQTKEGKYILLNTHFTLEDRQRKLAVCQERLNNKEKKEKVVLISTQLIEAGVDIDFPVVYRDLCPLPNLIQTAGRCNRNYKLDFGEVYFFEIKDKNNKSSAEKIYGRNFDWFLKFTRSAISTEICEKDMLGIQENFAKTQISDALPFGVYAFGKDQETNLVECINQIRFEDFAKVKLIDADYGVQLRIYVSRSDGEFEKLQKLFKEGKDIPPRAFTRIREHRSNVDTQIKRMSNRIVTVRIAENQFLELKNRLVNDDEKLFEIYLINTESKYSSLEGLRTEFEGAEII
jgi:CRISPR-associated endonuclease/helicase Cas3